MMDSEANFTKAYRQARRDFIVACQTAGADAISRVHPAKGPDGKALFCDSAAFGPRDAVRGLLVIAGLEGFVIGFLHDGFVLPKGGRLVAVHALDPFACAWGRAGAPADWPDKTLAAIAADDLSRVKNLTVLDMGASSRANGLEKALAQALPSAAITFHTLKPPGAGQAIRAAMDAL
jgi:Protein of unknown function (DUF2817)